MKRKFNLVIAVLILLTMSSCEQDDKPNSDLVIFKASLSGASEVPSNTSMATGSSVLTYHKSTKMFSIETTYDGFKPVMGHIHMAPIGENGAVIFPFSDVKTSPIKLESSMTDAQYKALENESFYVNLHSEKFPGGEIRGQLKKQ